MIDDENKNQQGITAYHGSPHDFDQFDTANIGTGEGAQAYGHGLYFAESEPTAKYYKDTLAHRGQIDLEHEANQREMPMSREAMIEVRRHANGSVDPLEAAKHMHWSSIEARQYPQEKLADLIDLYRKAKQGHMYEVHIDAHPDHFLDWDKPLSEQSFHIGKSIFDARKDNPTLFNVFKPHLEKDSTGMGFYQSLATQHPNGYQGATDFLQRAGIRGINYLDAGSRSAGEGSRNYVVFDPKDIEIMRRYARGGDVRAHFNDGGHASGGEVKNDLHLAQHLTGDRMDDDDNFLSQYGNKTMDAHKNTTDALRLAKQINAGEDSSSNYPEIVIPRTLAEVYAQKRAVDAARAAKKIHKPTMDDIFSQRLSGFEGAPPLAMPANLHELQTYNRLHFDEGGDVRPDANDMHDVSQPDQRDTSDAAIEAGNRQNAVDAQQATADVGRFGFGDDFNRGSAADFGLTPTASPTDIRDYTAQRLNTPYEGSLLSAAMDPSTAFGMGYPNLVGKQLSKEGAEALLANLGYESTQNGQVLNPQAISGSGYGLAQWTDPTRQKAFFEAMTPAGQLAPQTKEEKRALLGTTTAPQQLGYALNEIFNGGYAPTVNAITTPGNLASKVATVEQNYEGAGIPAIDKRIALANQIANNTGYGTFAQNTFGQAPTTQYASNIPTPIARPLDLGTVPAASFTQNTPVSTVSNDDPYGMSRYTSAINAMLNALPSNTQSKVANNQLKQNNIPFTGSTEDPELIAQQEKLQQEILMRLARGYASGGGVDNHISHALRLAASMGRGNDTMLAHINPREASLLKRMGGSGKRNPHTGLIEFDDETPDTSTENDKYHDMMNQTGWGSEDPKAIASFNENNAAKGYGLSGPQSYQGELAVGQRVPDTMVPGKDGQMHANLGSQVSDFLGNIFDPKFMGVNDPKYAEMAARKDNPNVGNTNDHGGGPDRFGQQITQAAETNAQKAATEAQPIVPYVAPPPFQPTQANVSPPYADFGASQSAISSAYNNPALNNLLKPQQVALATPYYNPYLKPFYASGGKVGNNNALANAMRMVLANKS